MYVAQDAHTKPWLQTPDSKGLHQSAVITPGNPLTLSWQSDHRTTGNWDNLYVYQKGTSGAADTYFLLDISAEFPRSSDLANSQGFEFEMQKVIGGYLYNGGWQADFGAGIWRTFNFGLGDWVSTPIMLKSTDFVFGKQTRITALYQALPKIGLQFLELVVNGIQNMVDYTDKAVDQAGDYLSYAFQLDSKNNGYLFNFEVPSYQVSSI